MSHVYGDSTPFPYDMDYIDLLRGAVDCSVQLLSAQHAIDTANQRNDELRNRHRCEQDELHSVDDLVRGALKPGVSHKIESVACVSSRIIRDAKQSVEDEVQSLKSETLNELAQNDRIITGARESACRAMASLIVHHDIPETGLCLTLVSQSNQYDIRVVMNTSFGVSAVCGIDPPDDHEWLLPRRVSSLSPDSCLYLPKRKSWFRQGTTLTATSLDRLFITEVTLDETHALLTLRKTPEEGSGFRIGIAYEQDPRAVVSRVARDGSLDPESAITLGGKDNAKALRLMRRVGESTRDLIRFRSAASSVVFENLPMTGLNEPGIVAKRLIAAMSPLARETARRSGAPGELVVRRDLGEGRREELYVTKNELYEKTRVLPPSLQAEFGPLGILKDLPRPAALAAGSSTQARAKRRSKLPPPRASISLN